LLANDTKESSVRKPSCKTCFYSRPDAHSDMSRPVPPSSDAELGVCEAIFNSPGQAMKPSTLVAGLQPTVNSSRYCSEHAVVDDVEASRYLRGGGAN
jgi:hypothetical protein